METEQARKSSCSFCGGKLTVGYHYTCHLCGAAYCFIHMSRHAKSHPRASEMMSSASSSGMVIIGQ